MNKILDSEMQAYYDKLSKLARMYQLCGNLSLACAMWDTMEEIEELCFIVVGV